MVPSAVIGILPYMSKRIEKSKAVLSYASYLKLASSATIPIPSRLCVCVCVCASNDVARVLIQLPLLIFKLHFGKSLAMAVF